MDPLEDIRREAEATRERIAGLEKLKEQEARKLHEDADRRGRPGPINRRGAAPPRPTWSSEGSGRQSELLRRQLAAMAQLQVRQMERMAEIQRGFFNDRRRMPWPVPPPPRPDFLPPPGGVARLREFQGPNGMRGFRIEFGPGGPGGPARRPSPAAAAEAVERGLKAEETPVASGHPRARGL